MDWLFSDAGLYRVSYALHQPCGELYCTLVSRYGLPDETASPDPLQPAGATWSWKGPATTLTFGAYATWCGVSLSGDKVKIVHERRE